MTTVDVLQDQMLRAIRDAKEAKRLYDARLQERISFQLKVDEAFRKWDEAKKTIAQTVTALEALVGIP
jgi:hypothetical protein